MVLSNKKLKQKLREAKAETLVIGESEQNTKKKSKRKADSNTELQELLEAAKQRTRLSKREKRRKTQSLQESGSLKDNVEAEEKERKKKRKRESDGIAKEVEVNKKKKKHKKKKKKEKKQKKENNANVESEGVVEEAAKENGENQVMEESGMRVYVGGIPYYSTEDDIRSYFESCGTITEVDCMTFPDTGKFRGIAIISFKTEAAAKRALALDGSDMGGFFLKIQPYKTTKADKEAKKVPNFAPQLIEGYNRIYIGNLYWDITEDDIKNFFSDCHISSIRFGMDKDTEEFKGYAHVDFSDSQSLATALKLDQQILCGRPVKISCAFPLKKGGIVQAGNVPPKKEPVVQAKDDPATNEANGQGTSSSTGKMKRRTCYECGEKGHITTACPNKQTSNPATSEPEVQAKDDPATNETDSRGTSSSIGKMKRRTCYECGEKGHITTACPNKQISDPATNEPEVKAKDDPATNETNSQGTSSSTGKMKRRTCYECGGKGHISTACPNKQTSDPANAGTI